MISLFFATQFGATLGLNQVYYTRNIESPYVLNSFVNVQPQLDQYISVHIINLKDATDEQASMAASGKKADTTVKADTATLKAAAEKFTLSLDLVKNCKGVIFSLVFQPYPVSLLEKCVSAGSNVTGLTPTSGPLVSVLVLMNWDDKEDDKNILGTARSLLEGIDEDAAATGQAVPYKDLNYACDF